MSKIGHGFKYMRTWVLENLSTSSTELELELEGKELGTCKFFPKFFSEFYGWYASRPVLAIYWAARDKFVIDEPQVAYSKTNWEIDNLNELIIIIIVHKLNYGAPNGIMLIDTELMYLYIMLSIMKNEFSNW